VSAWLTLDHRHPTPLHAQLEHGLRAAIATGRLAPGTQLPTVRQLAVDLSINANTVSRVYVHLERAGLLETRKGVGTFVAHGSARPAPRAGAEDPELAAIVRRCTNEAASRGFSVDDVIRQIRQQAAKQGG
jgi:GntR family transcriptional regulator